MTAKKIICLPSLTGSCEGCALPHSADPVAAQKEYAAKSSAKVCPEFDTPGGCRERECRALHVVTTEPSLAMKTTPTKAWATSPTKRKVPPIVRMASRVRGKAKHLDEVARTLMYENPAKGRKAVAERESLERRLGKIADDFDRAVNQLR